jgi:hypothetical protein
MANIFEQVVLLFVIVFCKCNVQLRSILLGLHDYYGAIYFCFMFFASQYIIYIYIVHVHYQIESLRIIIIIFVAVNDVFIERFVFP